MGAGCSFMAPGSNQCIARRGKDHCARPSHLGDMHIPQKEDPNMIPYHITSLVPEDTYTYHLRIHNDNLMGLIFYATPQA